LKDVLALQDEIAHDITEQIRVKLTANARSLVLQVRAVDPEAYDDYLRGRYWAYKENLEGGRKALEYYQKAIAKDPSYALAYAGLAEAYIVGWGSGLSLKEESPKVNEAAIKALELDPSLAEPHTSLAFIKLFNDWDFSGAEAEFKQSLALNPNLASAHLWYSHYLLFMQRLNEAVNECERARNLDPFNFWINRRLGQAFYHARRYDDALRQIRRTLEMFPDHNVGGLYGEIADVYEQKRMFAEAFAARQQALTLQKDPSVPALGEAYKRAGYKGYLLKQVEILEQGPPAGVRTTLAPELELGHQGLTFLYLAHLYALLGDEAHAMSYLERAYEDHVWALPFAATAPELDSIRSSPRFRDLVRRIGFPQSPADKN
jgi:tetratricopeptide (TPR) repeat protein